MTSPTEEAPVPLRRAEIVGTGLIGGSLGLALRRRGWHVTGRDSDPVRLEKALEMGVLDAVGSDPEAELVFIATPASVVASVATAVAAEEGRRSDVVISDVSGVKSALTQAIDNAHFIGGHPMAGSEQVGLGGADGDLFVGATWVLTPTEDTDAGAYGLLQAVITSLGADVLSLSPGDHDRLVAVVSHVPHLVAATLMDGASLDAEHHGALLRLAAGGFRDMTRIAAGDPGIWPDICQENVEEIVSAFDRLLSDLAEMRDRVANGDRAGLVEVLARASLARRSLSKGGDKPERLAEIRVPVPDRSGVLAELTTVAGDLGINIYDLEIAHSAEGPRGVAVLILDAARADDYVGALSDRGYRATVAGWA